MNFGNAYFTPKFNMPQVQQDDPEQSGGYQLSPGFMDGNTYQMGPGDVATNSPDQKKNRFQTFMSGMGAGGGRSPVLNGLSQFAGTGGAAGGAGNIAASIAKFLV